MTVEKAAFSLPELGWRNAFMQQLSVEELDESLPVRVLAVHRASLAVVGEGFEASIPPFFGEDEEERATVGDWMLIDRETHTPIRILDRNSLFKRRAAGEGRRVQLIAANVDTLFVVSSCNQDFNVARLERYLALAREADITPVVVLTKTDLAEDPTPYRAAAEGLMPGLFVELVNAKNPDDVARLMAWCQTGQTVAFVGSSGVGKSTLVNTLSGGDQIATQGIREDDAKGRHTTTHREMHRLAAGGWLMDTPGMRELQMTDVAAGIDEVFSDLSELAQTCKFNDCAHETEPGCAVQAAISEGRIDADRLRRWKKLSAEEAFNAASLAERRAKAKGFAKKVREITSSKQKRKKDL